MITLLGGDFAYFLPFRFDIDELDLGSAMPGIFRLTASSPASPATGVPVLDLPVEGLLCPLL